MSTVIPSSAIAWSAIVTRARDYLELTNMRVNSLILMTDWCGYYFGCIKSSAPPLCSSASTVSAVTNHFSGIPKEWQANG
jgi:heme O synthase-like polyprenyltransferase